MAESVIESTWRGPLGTATLTVYGPTGARTAAGVGSLQTLTMLEPPVVTWGTMTPKYGGGILAQEMIATLSDPNGVLAALRDAYPSERDVWAVLTTADGRGGTVYAHVKVTGAANQQTLSPRLSPVRSVEMEGRCGLAKLAEADGPPSFEREVVALMGDCVAAAEKPESGSLPIIYIAALKPETPAPDGSAGQEALYTRFLGKVAGSDTTGDNGTAEETALALAGTYTQSIFQPARFPAFGSGGAAIASGAPRVHVVPRSRAGLSYTALYGADETFGSATLPAATYTAPASSRYAEGEWGYIPRLGRITFEATPDVAAASFSVALGISESLGDGEERRSRAFALTPDATLQFRLESQSFTYTEFDATVRTAGKIRVELEGTDGTTYYGTSSGWTTTPTAISPDAAGAYDEVITLNLPVPGVVHVVLVGEEIEVDYVDGFPTTEYAVFEYARLGIEDTGGTPVTSIHVSAGLAEYGARDATLPLMPTVQVRSSSTWGEVTEWESDVTGLGGYSTLPEATAAERLASEGARLRYVRATLHGVLIGPEVRVTFPGTGTDNASPFSANVACVAVGLRWDLARGCTEGLWVEAGESGFTVDTRL